MATGTSIPIYLAAGAAGGIPASAGGARSVIVLSLSYVVERSVRSAPQLYGFADTHDPSVLDLVVSQTISLIAATVLAAMATRWAVREPPRSDALAISGSCFLGSLLALVELRASTIGIDGPPAAPPIAVLAALAIAPGLVIAVAASRRRISVRSQFVGASLVAITTGTTVIAELRGGIEPAFAVTASAPLLCGASVALAAVVIRSVDWGLVSRRAN